MPTREATFGEGTLSTSTKAPSEGFGHLDFWTKDTGYAGRMSVGWSYQKKIGGLYLQDRILVEKNCPGLKFEGQLKRGGTSFIFVAMA